MGSAGAKICGGAAGVGRRLRPLRRAVRVELGCAGGGGPCLRRLRGSPSTAPRGSTTRPIRGYRISSCADPSCRVDPRRRRGVGVSDEGKRAHLDTQHGVVRPATVLLLHAGSATELGAVTVRCNSPAPPGTRTPVTTPRTSRFPPPCPRRRRRTPSESSQFGSLTRAGGTRADPVITNPRRSSGHSVSPGVDPGHQFLAGVAPLGEAETALHQTRFGGDGALVELGRPSGIARLDPHRLPGPRPDHGRTPGGTTGVGPSRSTPLTPTHRTPTPTMSSATGTEWTAAVGPGPRSATQPPFERLDVDLDPEPEALSRATTAGPKPAVDVEDELVVARPRSPAPEASSFPCGLQQQRLRRRPMPSAAMSWLTGPADSYGIGAGHPDDVAWAVARRPAVPRRAS